MEDWRIVQDFPNYEVSNLGNVRNSSRPDFGRKIQVNHKGFPTLTLFKDESGSRFLRQLNKLVADAFLPQPRFLNYTAIWHYDGDLENCRVDNLKWDTRSRVLEWNDMHRTGQPKLRTSRILDNRNGAIYRDAYECGLAVGEIETAVVKHIESYAGLYQDRGKFRYI